MNVTFFNDGEKQHVIIDRGDNTFTSMPLEVWEAQQAAQNQIASV